MNKTLKSILIVITIIAFGYAVSFGINSVVRTNEINSKSAEFRLTFMEGCNESGKHSSYCTCVYNDLEDSTGTIGIYDVAIAYEETGKMPDDAVLSIYRCLDKL